MKKLLTILLAVCLLASLAACGQGGAGSSAGGATAASVAGASVADDGRETGGYAEGKIGDRMPNEFFAFTVLSAEKVNEYAGYTAADGMTLIVAEIKVENIFGDTVPMFSSDFQIQWGSDGEDDYEYPLEKYADDLMEDAYDLPKKESVTAKVVYEIPADTSEYSISYMEIYEDDFEGNVYFVYFSL